ncbi:MAG: response regulator [Proteobacteria bacterium]|nr:response regulator [Pseudomonadota bacterium]
MTRVLTVDDSKSMRQMIRFTLENAGIEVIEKSDGDEAYEWAQQNTAPDLILADINMPNMDGITLVQQLRSLNEYKNTPILMLTTDSSSERKQEGKSSGATGWIVKPFSPDHLVDTIFKVLSSPKLRE